MPALNAMNSADHCPPGIVRVRKHMVASNHPIDGEAGPVLGAQQLAAVDRRQARIHAATVTLRSVGRASPRIAMP